jgi:hypothetical protein
MSARLINRWLGRAIAGAILVVAMGLPIVTALTRM